MTPRVPFLIVISGPSGAGKTTLIRTLLATVADLAFSVSATTRSPRPTETDGVDYYFLTASGFRERMKTGDFLECAEVYGHWYGTLRGEVEQLLASGKDVVLDIDVQGAAQVRSTGCDAVFVFVMPPSLCQVRERIDARGTEDERTRDRRLKHAPVEVAARAAYDYVICNDRKEDAAGQLAAIVCAERCRTNRQARSTRESGAAGGGKGTAEGADGGNHSPSEGVAVGRVDASGRQQVYTGSRGRQACAAVAGGQGEAGRQPIG